MKMGPIRNLLKFHNHRYQKYNETKYFDSSDEETILLYCARSHLSENIVQALKEVIAKEKVDWNNLLVNAERHSVKSLIYYTLNKFSLIHLVPCEIMSYLEKSYSLFACRNTLLLSELGTMLSSLSQVGINVVVLKGAALAETVYPSIVLRPFGDIDLLIKAEDLFKVEKVLIDLGFIKDEKTLSFADAKEVMDYTYSFTQIVFKKKKPLPMYLEIHCNPIHLGISQDRLFQLWKRAIKIKIRGVSTLSLHPEDMLLHLCHHLYRHNYSRLIWLSDLSFLLDYYEGDINLSSLIKQVEGHEASIALYYGLFFAKVLLDCKIPPWVLTELKPGWLKRKIFERICHPEDVFHLKSKAKGRLTLRMTVLTVDGFFNKLKFFFSSNLPRAKWIKPIYANSKNIFSCYLNYFIDVLKKRL